MENQYKLKTLWEFFSNIPVDYDKEDEPIDEDFHVWETGTPRMDIWHWFDEKFEKGLGYFLENDIN